MNFESRISDIPPYFYHVDSINSYQYNKFSPAEKERGNEYRKEREETCDITHLRYITSACVFPKLFI